MHPTRSDFKYPTDFGFMKKCQIPSDSESESVTSLINSQLCFSHSVCVHGICAVCDEQMNLMMKRTADRQDEDASVSGQQRALTTMTKYVDSIIAHSFTYIC